jgi:hypothetical protein
LCLYSAKNRKHIEIVALSNTWPEWVGFVKWVLLLMSW